MNLSNSDKFWSPQAKISRPIAAASLSMSLDSQGNQSFKFDQPINERSTSNKYLQESLGNQNRHFQPRRIVTRKNDISMFTPKMQLKENYSAWSQSYAFQMPKTDETKKSDEYFKDFNEQQMKEFEQQKKLPYLELTEKEDQIIKFMKDALKYKKLEDKVQIKVAGDWVRDKCLGREAKNMSLIFQSSNVMSAQNLAEIFLDYEQMSTRVFIDNDYSSDYIGLRNYKHMSQPVAFVKLFGQELDICKIPEMSDIYPDLDLVEDAKDRDFTINSLYYSLDTDQVIDTLGQGLTHLEKKIIWPCSQKSLYNDPLRLFKAIELAAELDFEICWFVKDQIKDFETMQPLLDSKVNSQKIGEQLVKMLSDPDKGIKALELMCELDVISKYITRVPKKVFDYPVYGSYTDSQNAFQLAKIFQEAVEIPPEDEDESKLFKQIYFLCLLMDLQYDLSTLKQRMKELNLSHDIVDFVYNTLTRYDKVLDFNLGFSDESFVQKLKQEDHQKFLPIFCGVQKYMEEEDHTKGLGLDFYIKEYTEYLAKPYDEYQNEIYYDYGDRYNSLRYQKMMRQKEKENDGAREDLYDDEEDQES